MMTGGHLANQVAEVFPQVIVLDEMYIGAVTVHLP